MYGPNDWAFLYAKKMVDVSLPFPLLVVMHQGGEKMKYPWVDHLQSLK